MEFPKSEFEKPLTNKDEDVLKIVRTIRPVSESENGEWSLEELQNFLMDAFRQAGEESIKENNGTIYTTLSGGIDSTLALALLRKNFPKTRIVTITMGGDENHPDVIHARMAAEKFGSQHQEIIPQAEDIQEAITEYQQKFPGIDIKKAGEEGDFDVYLLYKNISQLGLKALIVHDGIDELMGGYWRHRKGETEEARKKAFLEYWDNLIPGHLVPLLKTSQSFGIHLIFPYLQEKLARYISEIPISDRVTKDSGVKVASATGKKPMRIMAKIFEVPEEIIRREKRGQIGMLELEERRKIIFKD